MNEETLIQTNFCLQSFHLAYENVDYVTIFGLDVEEVDW